MGLLLSAGFLPLNRLYLNMNDDDSRNKPIHDRAGHPLAADAPLDAAPDDPRREPIFTDASKNPWIVEDSTDTEDEYHVADAEQSGTAQEQELFEDGDGEEGLADDEPDDDWDDQESECDDIAEFRNWLQSEFLISPPSDGRQAIELARKNHPDLDEWINEWIERLG